MTTIPIPAPALPSPPLEQPTAVRTWRPKTAGILNIIAGVIIISMGAGISALLTEEASQFIDVFRFYFGIDVVPYILAAVAVLVAFGIVIIVGGIFSIKRRVYGMALAGSILAAITVFFLGIPALIFVAEARREFSRS